MIFNNGATAKADAERYPGLHQPSARTLDRLADFELQHGHHARAEELSHRALELREGGR